MREGEGTEGREGKRDGLREGWRDGGKSDSGKSFETLV